MTTNLHAAWICFLLGGLAGIVPGLYFHRADWLGGYASWPRRMIRLAHIAFFGIGLLNLAFALTVRSLGIEDGVALSAVLLIVGAITMPLVCYLSAYRIEFRRLFPVLEAGRRIAARAREHAGQRLGRPLVPPPAVHPQPQVGVWFRRTRS